MQKRLAERESDTYIHLQGSQAGGYVTPPDHLSDTYIHLQGSQADNHFGNQKSCLIPIFTYKVLKLP